jgi:hypothetical protein
MTNIVRFVHNKEISVDIQKGNNSHTITEIVNITFMDAYG